MNNAFYNIYSSLLISQRFLKSHLSYSSFQFPAVFDRDKENDEIDIILGGHGRLSR